MTRREFLMALGGLALASIGSHPFIRPFLPGETVPLVVPQKPTGGTARPRLLYSIWEGEMFRSWTVASSTDTSSTVNFPGPTIRVREGDKVRITVNNHLGQPTTFALAWRKCPVSDGRCTWYLTGPIQPGQSFTYEFIAGSFGTRWYHSRVNGSDSKRIVRCPDY